MEGPFCTFLFLNDSLVEPKKILSIKKSTFPISSGRWSKSSFVWPAKQLYSRLDFNANSLSYTFSSHSYSQLKLVNKFGNLNSIKG